MSSSFADRAMWHLVRGGPNPPRTSGDRDARRSIAPSKPRVLRGKGAGSVALWGHGRREGSSSGGHHVGERDTPNRQISTCPRVRGQPWHGHREITCAENRSNASLNRARAGDLDAQGPEPARVGSAKEGEERLSVHPGALKAHEKIVIGRDAYPADGRGGSATSERRRQSPSSCAFGRDTSRRSLTSPAPYRRAAFARTSQSAQGSDEHRSILLRPRGVTRRRFHSAETPRVDLPGR